MSGPKKKSFSRKDVDNSFDAFLKESISSEESSIDTARIMKFLDPKKGKKKDRNWWMKEVDEEDSDTALGATGSKFLKQSKPQPSKDPNTANQSRKSVEKSVTFSQDVGLSRDSLDDESLGPIQHKASAKGGGPVPALSLGSMGSSQGMTDTEMSTSFGPGKDTLDEIADKERFFKDLENSEETLDFSRLNRDLDNSNTLAVDYHDRTEETAVSDEAESPILPAKRISISPDDQAMKEAGGHDLDMLSKVALVDSLDSTIGTKLAGSKETRDSEDMLPIPEGTHEEDVTQAEVKRDTRRARFKDDDSINMLQYLDDDIHSKNPVMDSRAHTLKTTGTGIGTDTSKEFEALHSAMRYQVGMGTLDDTKNFTLLTQTSTNQTQDLTEGNGTGVFGLKPVLALRQTQETSERTVDDILREVEHFKGHSTGGGTSKQLETEDDIDGYGAYGFGLSPAHASGYGLINSSGGTEDGLDEVPFEKFRPKDTVSESILQTPPGRSHSRDQSQEYPNDSPHVIPAKQPVRVEKKSKFANVKSSGYGARTPSPKRSSRLTQKTWNPADIQKQKIKGSESTATIKNNLELKTVGNKGIASGNPLAENHLAQSVQSFANYIQDQFSSFTMDRDQPVDVNFHQFQSGDMTSFVPKTSSLDREHKLVREVQDWQERWQEERRMLAKVKAQLSALERESKNKMEQLRMDKEQEIFKLKQENYVLSAKIAEDNQRRPVLDMDSLDDASKQQVALLESEVREQEKLLAGYQHENERLYQDMKKLQQATKDNEEQMFRKNQKISSELANVKEQLVLKEQQLKNKGLTAASSVQPHTAMGNVSTAVLGAGKIAQLEAELKQAKSREAANRLERDTLVKTKAELEQHIVQLVHNIEQLESKISDAKITETQSSLLKYEKEIERLKDKLKWYAENQELLDKDASKIKQQEDEIKRLKEKLESSTTDAGRKAVETRLKTKEKMQDAKKIQDLERQVREMETIIRKRHPNSLPALMWAASNADGTVDNKAPSVVYLERRILKLEQELDQKDEEAKKSLRVIEQKYNNMKLQYEERIQSLERQNEHDIKEGDRPHTHAVALQRELDSTKERLKKKIMDMEAEIEKYKQELVIARNKENTAMASKTRLAKEMENETSLRVKALQLQVSNQEQEKQKLEKTIEKLQIEKNQMAVDMTRTLSLANKVQGEKLNSELLLKTRVLSKGRKVGAGVLPAYPDTQTQDKQYEPMTFSGHHISDILQENDQLKHKMEILQMDLEQQRIMSQKLLAESEAMSRHSHEETDDRVSALRTAHQLEIKRILSDHAMQHSTSKLAELHGQLNTQEVMLKHLREQLAQSSVDRERLSQLTIREAASETQVKQLQEQLKQAKEMHTPEMKHFISLQDKIRDMETRHAQRERELQSIIQHSHSMANTDMADEIHKWRRMVDSKNHELEHFRNELDSILDVLKELQRQGIVLSYKGLSSGNSANR